MSGAIRASARRLPGLSAARAVTPLRPAVPVRGMVGAPALMEAATATTTIIKESPGAAAAAAGSAAKAAGSGAGEAVAKPEAAPAAHAPAPSSSVWQRFTAFLTGVGLSSAYFFYGVTEEVRAANAAVEDALVGFKGEAAKVNAELQARVATLEHAVQALKEQR